MNVKMVIAVRKDLNMRRGKSEGQVGHAVQEAILDRSDPDNPKLKTTPDILAWLASDFRKIVVSVKDEAELMELYRQTLQRGWNHYLVTDKGHTEFHGVPTFTTLAIGPLPEDVIDELTGEMPLR